MNGGYDMRYAHELQRLYEYIDIKFDIQARYMQTIMRQLHELRKDIDQLKKKCQMLDLVSLVHEHDGYDTDEEFKKIERRLIQSL